ncbi:MAG: hypothetical protein M1438_00860 [Deltaproteobacteria bacterium]|nr:hypothetical protein [Deltaproteobacteria bacterium]
MSTKKELHLEEYIKKLQEAAWKIVDERNVINNKVIYLSADNAAFTGEGEQLGIFKEALSRVNEEYELKAEA